jgi:hypothetical protein
MCIGCSDDPNDPDQNPGPGPGPITGGDVTITGVSAGFNFWLDELTITGTGFSSVKEENIVRFLNITPVAPSCTMNYSSESGGAIEIISTSETQIKIKIPAKLNINNDVVCGPESATIEVTVKDKKATIANIEFSPLPYVGAFQYHYGWFDHPSVTRIGDSLMMSGGLLGTKGPSSPLWNKVRLSIAGKPVPIKFRSIGLESGWAFYLDAKEFGEIHCEEGSDGWNARELPFTFSIEGTDKSATRNLRVEYLPTATSFCSDCPTFISKSAGGNPVWKISGKDMFYKEARFSSSNCNEVSQSIGITSALFGSELDVAIPLSILSEGCSYSIFLVDKCDGVKLMGGITIQP